jgi:hypothetical protein
MKANETKKHYHDAMKRATYYRWAAARPQTLPGGDPATGTPRNHWIRRRVFEDEAKVAYKAMARFWLEKARAIREA